MLHVRMIRGNKIDSFVDELHKSNKEIAYSRFTLLILLSL